MENRSIGAIPSRAQERVSRPHDARAVKSRAAIREGLLVLIDRKPLDQITIKEITLEAKVSYPVFFRQFGTKEAVLADIATEEVRSVLQRVPPAFEREGTARLQDMCEFVQQRRKLWATLLSDGANGEMRAEFSRLSNEIAEQRPRVNPKLPPDLVTELVVNAIFDILTWWMRQPEDYPVGNVVKLLDGLVVRIFTKPIDLNLE